MRYRKVSFGARDLSVVRYSGAVNCIASTGIAVGTATVVGMSAIGSVRYRRFHCILSLRSCVLKTLSVSFRRALTCAKWDNARAAVGGACGWRDFSVRDLYVSATPILISFVHASHFQLIRWFAVGTLGLW